jgi:hypothetical protein
MKMKFGAVISSILVVVCMATLAAAPKQQPTPVERDPLFFVHTAADVANNVRHESLDGYFAVFVNARNWAAGLKDGDLGLFLKGQEPKPDRGAVCFFSGDKNAVVCVYFDGDTAYGAVAVRAGASGKIQADDVSKAYRNLSKDMLKKSDARLRFEKGDVATDDGIMLPAYQVTAVP